MREPQGEDMPEPSPLRAARKAAGLSQTAVAEALGVEQVTISRYERGRRVPSDVVVAMARLYGVSTDVLLGVTS